ncbi:unnamed protein product [Leptidea sinapis]|uniref:Uncharacterized protein n=1 Tax=Leptidea sinapis TaxID=189913 RepID=A0A5E4PUQ4_9NEOP|nr:unnamed protein product [Leptidea sinapis]
MPYATRRGRTRWVARYKRGGDTCARVCRTPLTITRQHPPRTFTAVEVYPYVSPPGRETNLGCDLSIELLCNCID